MLLMFATDGRLIIGLTKTNVERLMDLKPAAAVGPRPMTVQRIVVMYGEDKPAILRQLEEAGVEVAQAYKDAALMDPL